MHYKNSQTLAARQASSKPKLTPPSPLSINVYDVIVIFVTSRGAKIQMFGAPDGDYLAGVVGACHDGRVRIWATHIRWGSWDPNGSCPPIKTRIQGQTEQRLSTLSSFQYRWEAGIAIVSNTCVNLSLRIKYHPMMFGHVSLNLASYLATWFEFWL